MKIKLPFIGTVNVNLPSFKPRKPSATEGVTRQPGFDMHDRFEPNRGHGFPKTEGGFIRGGTSGGPTN